MYISNHELRKLKICFISAVAGIQMPESQTTTITNANCGFDLHCIPYAALALLVWALLPFHRSRFSFSFYLYNTVQTHKHIRIWVCLYVKTSSLDYNCFIYHLALAKPVSSTVLHPMIWNLALSICILYIYFWFFFSAFGFHFNYKKDTHGMYRVNRKTHNIWNM